MTRIYVCTHTRFDLPPDAVRYPSLYLPLQVGREGKEDLGYTPDNSGDNISELNPLFGELTGLYWVWKNVHEPDYVGICHYRRYFTFDHKTLPTEEEFEEKFTREGADIITSDRPLSRATPRETYAEAHNIHDLEACGRSLSRLYPAFEESFREILYGHPPMCYGNLCLMPKETYDAYCAWLFSILFDASEEIDVTSYDLYHRRVYGFLSEVLFNVYIHDLEKKGGRVLEADVLCTDEKKETRELKLALSQLLKMGHISEAVSLYRDFVKVRPDVLLPMSDILGELPIIEEVLYMLSRREAEGKGYDLRQLIRDYRTLYAWMQAVSRGENIDLPEGLPFTREDCEVILENDLFERFHEKGPLDPDRVRAALEGRIK